MVGDPSKIMTKTQGLTDVKSKILFCSERQLKESARYYFYRDDKSVYDINKKDLISPLMSRYKHLAMKGYSLVFKFGNKSKILIFNS